EMTDWIAMVIAGGVSITASLKPCCRRIARSLASRATVVCANAGYSASRSFHQSAREPWGSMSISTTGPAPARCAWTARCPESVVFPDPPFCEANASTRKAYPPDFEPETSNFPAVPGRGSQITLNFELMPKAWPNRSGQCRAERHFTQPDRKSVVAGKKIDVCGRQISNQNI